MKPDNIYFTDGYEIHMFGQYVSVCWVSKFDYDEMIRKGEPFIGFFYVWFDDEDGWCSEPINLSDERIEVDDAKLLLEELTNAIQYLEEYHNGKLNDDN